MALCDVCLIGPIIVLTTTYDGWKFYNCSRIIWLSLRPMEWRSMVLWRANTVMSDFRFHLQKVPVTSLSFPLHRGIYLLLLRMEVLYVQSCYEQFFISTLLICHQKDHISASQMNQELIIKLNSRKSSFILGIKVTFFKNNRKSQF